MTCIVALVHPAGVIVGADSLVLDDDQRSRDSHKIRRRLGVVLGAGGDCDLCDVATGLRCPPCRGEVGSWLRDVYLPRLLRAAKKHQKEAPECDAVGKPQLYVMAANATGVATCELGGSVMWPLDDCMAIGIGAPYALGALYASKGRGDSPKARVAVALAAAERHCSAVGGPWVWGEIKR